MARGGQFLLSLDNTYGPFGATTMSSGNSSNPAQYTGRDNDGTGLYYYRARYYAPHLHRFTSEDPLGFAGATNLYQYVSNSPTNGIDPTGEVAWFIGPVVGGVVSGGINLGMQLWELDGRWDCVDWPDVGKSAVIGAIGGSVGPGGAFFGRGRLGAPKWWGNVNVGRDSFRFGWSWDKGRNWFGAHGGKYKTPGHWHNTPIPGPKNTANLEFGIGGGVLGGAAGHLFGREPCK